jgi:hypothetical protein
MKESLLGPCSLLMVVCVCAHTHTHTAHTRTDDTRGSGGRHAQGHRPRTQTHRCCSRAACEGCDSCPCPRKPMLCQYLVLLHSPDACSYSWSPCECESSLRVLPRIVSIDRPFIVLTETKPSKRHIPVWARYSPHRTRVEARANTLSP